MKVFSVIISLVLFFTTVSAQGIDIDSASIGAIVPDPEGELYNKSFHGTRIINGHSVETLSKGYMEMRIEHRFGDIAGVNGGYQNMFGFDNLSDMRIALEYGISNDLMVGFGRSKGTGAPYRSLLDGFVKYRALRQRYKSRKFPISIAVIGGSSFTYMKASSDLSEVSNFPQALHRLSYFTQVNFTRKFGDWVSLAVIPTFMHRNYVSQNDQNDIFSLGSALRIKLSGQFAVIGEYYYTFRDKGLRPADIYKNSIGIALEWQTFGHNFTLNFTNSGGLGETQFIPYTLERIMDGQFRFGFCVGRKFIINE
ncbi:MAG: hypothetical protein FJZ66_10375 [Bacteroidetes bacterium]|nr:hypothetical protein [Bacteroidota bacterium]